MALQFVSASILSSGDAVNKPTLVTKTVVNASQLTTVSLSLGEVVTYRGGGTPESPLLIEVSFRQSSVSCVYTGLSCVRLIS